MSEEFENIVGVEIVTEDIEFPNEVPIVHRFGKFALGGLAGLTATILTEKLYDVILEAYRARKGNQ